MNSHSLVFAVLSVLAIGLFSIRAAKILRIPQNVFLLLSGLAGGLWLRYVLGTQASLLLTENLPQFMIDMLLPPILFASAYAFKPEDLKNRFGYIVLLSTVGTAMSIVFISSTVGPLFQMPAFVALIFGALMSTPDPKVSGPLFHEVGAPRKLGMVVEGEALFGSAVALILFTIFRKGFESGVPRDVSFLAIATYHLLKIVLCGAVVGAISGAVLSAILRTTTESPAAQLGTTILAAFMSFALAERFIDMSGVVASLVMGLYLGIRSRTDMHKDTQHSAALTWESLSLMATTLVFIGVGLAMDLKALSGRWMFVAAGAGIVYFCRFGSVLLTSLPYSLWGPKEPLPLGQQVAISWGGLRGGLALILVLSFPESFKYKQEFIAIAITVVFANILINGMTLRNVLDIFGINRLTALDENFFRHTLQVVQGNVFAPLQELAKTGGVSKTLVESSQAEFQAGLGKSETQEISEQDAKRARIQFDINALLLKEKSLYDMQMDDGTISPASYQQLSTSVRERIEAFESGGLENLKHYRHRLGDMNALPKWVESVRERIRPWKFSHLRHRLELLLNIRTAVEHISHDSPSPEITEVVDLWRKSLNMKIDEFHRAFPGYSAAVQSAFIANTVCSSSEKTVNQLVEAGVLNHQVYLKAWNKIRHARRHMSKNVLHLMKPRAEFLIKRVPLFQSLGDETLRNLAAHGRRKSFRKDEIIVQEGAAGNAFYLILSGVMQINSTKFDRSFHPKLFTGDFFGEMSLIFGTPCMATVRALVPSEIFVLDRHAFDALLAEQPAIRARIMDIAEARAAQAS